MEDAMESPRDKQAYRGPEIVDVGGIEALTTGHSTPVRDLESNPPTYYNANPPSVGQGVEEVDLGDR
jgi:hypothetical protein